MKSMKRRAKGRATKRIQRQLEFLIHCTIGIGKKIRTARSAEKIARTFVRKLCLEKMPEAVRYLRHRKKLGSAVLVHDEEHHVVV